jgi:hypothetical protein
MMNPVMLPEHLEEITIKDMIIGETGWIVPWGMYADSDGYLYVNGGYTYSNVPGGTVDTKIEMTSRGLIVDISRSRRKEWAKDDCPHFGGDPNPVPVVELVE